MITRMSPIEKLLDQLTSHDQPIKPGLWMGREYHGRKWVIGTVTLYRRSIVVYSNLNEHGARTGSGWMTVNAFQDWKTFADATHREGDLTASA